MYAGGHVSHDDPAQRSLHAHRHCDAELSDVTTSAFPPQSASTVHSTHSPPLRRT